MQVSIGKAWISIFQSALLPGEKVGSGLFPAISAFEGKKVRYNWGFDLQNRPFTYAPPSPDFLPIAATMKTQVFVHATHYNFNFYGAKYILTSLVVGISICRAGIAGALPKRQVLLQSNPFCTYYPGYTAAVQSHMDGIRSRKKGGGDGEQKGKLKQLLRHRKQTHVTELPVPLLIPVRTWTSMNFLTFCITGRGPCGPASTFR